MSMNELKTAFGTVEIKVSPQIMNQTADSINKKITQLKERFSLLEEKIFRTKEYWEGATAENTRNLFVNEKQNFEAILNNISTYSEELYIITKNYESTETAVANASNELPSDILR